MKKALVAYFSASGVTAGLAKTLCGAVDGDLLDLVSIGFKACVLVHEKGLLSAEVV